MRNWDILRCYRTHGALPCPYSPAVPYIDGRFCSTLEERQSMVIQGDSMFNGQFTLAIFINQLHFWGLIMSC